MAIGELRPRRHPSLAPLLAGRLLRAAWRIHRLAAPYTAAARYRTHLPAPCRPAQMAMQVTVKSWHAVASWTWTSEDDVCGICHMPLDGCAPGAPGPGDDSPVVWGRVRTIRRAVHMLSLPGHSFPRLVVLALLPPHVHQHLAAQQEHLPDLPAEVGVRQVRSLTPPPPPPRAAPPSHLTNSMLVVRRSQLQRRPARREALQQTADRREARGFWVCGMRPSLGESVFYRCVPPVWIFVSSVYVVRE